MFDDQHLPHTFLRAHILHDEYTNQNIIVHRNTISNRSDHGVFVLHGQWCSHVAHLYFFFQNIGIRSINKRRGLFHLATGTIQILSATRRSINISIMSLQWTIQTSQSFDFSWRVFHYKIKYPNTTHHFPPLSQRMSQHISWYLIFSSIECLHPPPRVSLPVWSCFTCLPILSVLAWS